MQYNFNNEYPIYLQIVEIITSEITSGTLKPGEKLLSVREYAQKFRVNPNTVVKALSILEDDKLIYAERTNGKFVTNDEELIKNFKEKNIMKKLDDFLGEMNQLGYSKEEIIKMLKEK